MEEQSCQAWKQRTSNVEEEEEEEEEEIEIEVLNHEMCSRSNCLLMFLDALRSELELRFAEELEQTTFTHVQQLQASRMELDRALELIRQKVHLEFPEMGYAMHALSSSVHNGDFSNGKAAQSGWEGTILVQHGKMDLTIAPWHKN